MVFSMAKAVINHLEYWGEELIQIYHACSVFNMMFYLYSKGCQCIAHSDHQTLDMVTMDRWPQWTDHGHNGQMATMDRWPQGTGDHNGQVTRRDR